MYLYSEVMPYAIAVMRAMVREFGVQVDCIYWDQKKRTPFLPSDEQGIYFHKRSTFDERSIVEFIEKRNPSAMYIVGRMDDLYLKTALHFRSSVKIVTGSDNQWYGNLKQRVATVLSGMLYRRYFEYFWVPGRRQYEFARRMGYPNEKIISNLLTADTDIFGEVYERDREIKRRRYPHNMVFAGRFAKTKGVDILIEAFTEAKEATNNDWQLTLIGSGDNLITDAPFIKVKDFMQGPELAKDCSNWGVFCLPSIYEPWGVVIHEFTMSGIPVLCSDKVGAADSLVVDNYNGYVFKSGDKQQLKQAIIKFMSKSDKELFAMGERGYALSKMHSPVISAYSFLSVTNE